MELLFSAPFSQGSFQFFVPPGQYGAFVVTFAGTNAAGVTMTRLNLGSVTTQWGGKDILSTIDIDFLNRIDNVYGGVSAFSSAIGAAVYCYTYIPCGEWYDSLNVYDIGSQDQVSIRCEFADLANVAIAAGGTITVYGLPKLGVMNYLHKMTTRNVTFQGASTFSDNFALNNCAQVYLKDPVANLVTRYLLRKDGQTVVNANIADLIANSDFIHTLETTNSMLAMELSQSKNVQEAIGKSVSYEITASGATTVPQYFSYIDFTPQKAVSSALRQAEIINQRAM